MAANAADLLSLLCLDPKFSRSPYGGNHRTLLIERDFSNSGDFVFNSLLQHFGRREPNTPILLVALSHDWLHYSACAAKCGFNLRKKQNMGNIEVLDVMQKSLDDMCRGVEVNYCDHILNEVKRFIGDSGAQQAAQGGGERPTVILFDDLSSLLTLGAKHADIYKLMMTLDSIMRQRSERFPAGRVGHLVVQTLSTTVKSKQSHVPQDDDLNFLIANLKTMSDLFITLRPLETGHSTKVDGTIKISDNRLAAEPASRAPQVSLSMLGSTSASDIGSQRSYFYKLADRRARLTSSALAS